MNSVPKILSDMNQYILNSYNIVKGKHTRETKVKHRAHWRRLFNYYNSSNPANGPLCLDCNPCYLTVFQFVQEKVKGVMNESA